MSHSFPEEIWKNTLMIVTSQVQRIISVRKFGSRVKLHDDKIGQAPIPGPNENYPKEHTNYYAPTLKTPKTKQTNRYKQVNK